MAVDKLEYKNHQNEDPLTEIFESTLTNSNVANDGSLNSDFPLILFFDETPCQLKEM